ncbi:MAG TPA: hypothetical protein DDZ41_09725 [Flavobacterium sp.]|nr:hypothetical protein [Flavobacterium sp.]
MNIYKSKRSKRLNAVFVVSIALIIAATIPALLNDIRKEFYIVIVINTITLILLISIVLKTEYKIDDAILRWQSGPFYGKINIQKIQKIEHHTGIYIPTFWKPALSQVGLIIRYNEFDTIYISPINQSKFIAQLIEINPKIKVV